MIIIPDCRLKIIKIFYVPHAVLRIACLYAIIALMLRLGLLHQLCIDQRRRE